MQRTAYTFSAFVNSLICVGINREAKAGNLCKDKKCCLLAGTQSKPKVVANSKKEESTQRNKSTKENKQVKSQGEMEQDNQQNQQDEEMTCSNM